MRPRAGGRAPATTGDRTPTRPTGGSRSTAAQRAYAKRSQRAEITAPVVRTTRGSLTARIPFVALVIGLLSVGLAITLLLTTRAAEDSYKLSAAKAHNQELVERKAALERDVRVANSAPELARKAAQQGMIPAKEVARLVVAADGTVTVVGEPKPATGTPVTPPPAPAAATTPLRGSGVAAANLPPVGSRATTPEPAAAPAGPGVAVAPAPAATPQPVNPRQPVAEQEQLVPMERGEQAGNQGGPQ
ncbi:hypothetical protein ACFWPA_16040 [Rhodococcus sp. NPDC058505]|uniref:hypothetical protein n=1 Tax=unclassified Rhodococcus (in: high G+C Gram-positive bacteria) TaxID=192944 RepID=UPI00366196C8